jgi:Xaa-Pro aminopeptidase
MNVLIHGDTIRTPELRHEVPLGIPDSFFYAEVDGRRVVAISAMEAMRVEGLGTGLEVHPLEEFGADELRRSGIDAYAYANELAVRIVRGLGIAAAMVPLRFPLGIADTLRSDGIELEVDQKLFDDRRRSKSAHELAGIRRAQKAAEAGIATARDLLRRAEPANGGLSVDGERLTCELVKERVQAAFLANGAVADQMIVSHGPQTAIGHEMGSAQSPATTSSSSISSPWTSSPPASPTSRGRSPSVTSRTRSASGTRSAGRRSSSRWPRCVRA